MSDCRLLSRGAGDIATVGECRDASGNSARMSVGGIGGVISASATHAGRTIEFTPANCRR